jgi:catechol-2,3-dioxygenase
MLKLAKLGHIVLRVRDLERSKHFYGEILGLKQTGEIAGRMAFFSAGEDSHDLALMAIGPDAPGPDPHRVGLYHFAYQVRSREELSQWLTHLVNNDVNVVGSADHGVSMGIYLTDPDGNEIELTYEVPREQWPDVSNPFATSRPLRL